jgi:hypothetical protein
MLETIHNLPLMIAQRFDQITAAQQVFLLLVASFVVGNLLFYFFTRGKEFAVTGLTAALFLVPFVRLA